jgi:hypothetical protein
MRIGGDGVGKKALFSCRDGIAEPKAAGAVAHVKDDAALLRLPENRVDLSILQKDGKLLCKNMRVDIPRTHL